MADGDERICNPAFIVTLFAFGMCAMASVLITVGYALVLPCHISTHNVGYVIILLCGPGYALILLVLLIGFMFDEIDLLNMKIFLGVGGVMNYATGMLQLLLSSYYYGLSDNRVFRGGYADAFGIYASPLLGISLVSSAAFMGTGFVVCFMNQMKWLAAK